MNDDKPEILQFRESDATWDEIARVSSGPPKVLENYTYKLDFDTDVDRGLRWAVWGPGGAGSSAVPIATGWAVNMHAMAQAVEALVNGQRVRNSQPPLPDGAAVFTIDSRDPETT